MNDTVHNVAVKNDIEIERRRFLCPLCGKHTLLWLLSDTAIKNLPIKCKRCGREIIVNVEPLSESQNCMAVKSNSAP